MFGVLFLLCISATDVARAQSVKPLSEQGLQSLIQNRNGKILLLNIWATWCQPCKEEFPDLIAVSDSLKTTIEVVALSVDFPDEIHSKILPFLRTMKVPFQVFVSDISSQDDFFHQFDENWGGAIPVTFIYDTSGIQSKMLIGKTSYAGFQNAIDLIKKK